MHVQLVNKRKGAEKKQGTLCNLETGTNGEFWFAWEKAKDKRATKILGQTAN